MNFILDWVWVKSLNGGMSNASRFMTQHVFKDPNPILNQGDWSGRGQAIVVKFDHKLFEALCDHHKSSCLILPIISTSHIGMPAHVGTIVKDYSETYKVPTKSQGRARFASGWGSLSIEPAYKRPKCYLNLTPYVFQIDCNWAHFDCRRKNAVVWFINWVSNWG